MRSPSPGDHRPVLVAVIDSGWDRSIDHARVRPGIGLVDPDDQLSMRRSDDDHDRIGHGTNCSRIVMAEAPTALVVPIRVFGDRLETSVEHLCEGLRLATDWGVELVNMSLATIHPVALVPLYSACEGARRKGITVVAAADARTGLGFPAIFDNVLGVAAKSRSDAESGYRYRPGKVVDFVASGSPPEEISMGSSPDRTASSFAAARMCGYVADMISRGLPGDLAAVRERLIADSARNRPSPAAKVLHD